MRARSNLVKEMAVARPLATINGLRRGEWGRRRMRTRVLFLCVGALLYSHVLTRNALRHSGRRFEST